MKMTNKILLAVAVVALVGGMQPVIAGCPSAHLLDAAGKGFVSNPAWPAGYNYSFYSPVGPALTPDFTASFWSQTTGNPALGAGDDNGGFDSSAWISSSGGPDYPGAPYYAYYTQAITPGTNWSAAGDGCVNNQGATPNNDGTECTCVGAFDQRDGVGYFALLSDQRNISGNFEFGQWVPGANIDMAPVPAPTIVNSTGNGTGVDLTVLVDPPAAGLYLDPACGPCAQISYSVRSVVVPRGAGSPNNRVDGSFPGPSTAPAPVGTTSSLTVGCSTAQEEVWIATDLIIDSGYETTYLSGDSLQVNCGADLADPYDLDVKPRPTQKPGKPRIDRPRRR